MRPTAQTMRHLTRRVGAGDHAAFRRLYEILAPSTLVAIQHQLPDPIQSMHVLRRTFCELWWTCSFDLRCGNLRPDVAAWVGGIADQRCVERLRVLELLDATSGLNGRVTTLVGFLNDHDQWTQFQLAEMINGRTVVAPGRHSTRARRRRGPGFASVRASSRSARNSRGSVRGRSRNNVAAGILARPPARTRLVAHLYEADLDPGKPD